MIVAIYSGIIPSTTFIENLIKEVSIQRCHVLLFGNKTCRKKYNENVTIHSIPNHKIFILPYVLLFITRLSFTRFKDVKYLFYHMIKLNRVFALRVWAKYLPVVFYRPDIFHIQWAKSAEEWMFLKRFGIRIIVSFRGFHINVSPIVCDSLAQSYRKLFPNIDFVHAVSQNILLNGMNYGVDINKASVIYPAVSPSLIEKPFYNMAKKYSDFFNILSIGRNHWKKGYRIALDCCAILKAKHFKFQYTIIGGIYEELIYQINDMDLSEYVILKANLSHEDVLNSYQKSDVFLLPSVEEGVANVVLEAMAIGTPVISTNCGGMEEVIQHDINGWIVPIRNAQTMAEQIIQLYNYSREHIELIRENARNTIKEKHLLPQQAKAMINLYKQVL